MQTTTTNWIKKISLIFLAFTSQPIKFSFFLLLLLAKTIIRYVISVNKTPQINSVISKKEIGKIDEIPLEEVNSFINVLIKTINKIEIKPNKTPVMPCKDKLWILGFNFNVNLVKAKTTKKKQAKKWTFQQLNVIN